MSMLQSSTRAAAWIAVLSLVGECGPVQDAAEDGGGVPLPAPSFVPSPAVQAQHTQGGHVVPCMPDLKGPKLNGRQVGGSVQFVCPDTPQSWSASLYLEYRSTSNVAVWEQVDTDQRSDPGHDMFLYDSCRVGDWQIRYTVFGTGSQGGEISMADAKETWIGTCP